MSQVGTNKALQDTVEVLETSLWSNVVVDNTGTTRVSSNMKTMRPSDKSPKNLIATNRGATISSSQHHELESVDEDAMHQGFEDPVCGVMEYDEILETQENARRKQQRKTMVTAAHLKAAGTTLVAVRSWVWPKTEREKVKRNAE